MLLTTILFVGPVLIIITVFVATPGADRSHYSPGVGSHLHAGTPCAAVIGKIVTRPNG